MLAGPSVASSAPAPTLSFNTNSATARGLASSCTSPSGRYAHLKSGVVLATQPLVATGCAPALLSVTGRGSKLFWSDGSDSTLDIAVNTDPFGTFAFGFSILAGTMKGAKITVAPRSSR